MIKQDENWWAWTNENHEHGKYYETEINYNIWWKEKENNENDNDEFFKKNYKDEIYDKYDNEVVHKLMTSLARHIV